MSARTGVACTAQLAGLRTLHQYAPDSTPAGLVRGEPCLRSARTALAQSTLAFVMTYSGGSRGAAAGFKGRHFNGLRELASTYSGDSSARLIIEARGVPCLRPTADGDEAAMAAASVPPMLRRWMSRSGGICIDGPNRGAREAHTILQFCAEWYESLPRALIFVQDDPEVQFMRTSGVGTESWLRSLESAFAARLAARDSGVAPPPTTDEHGARPWEPPCPCFVDRERNFEMGAYGAYRPMHWWLRTFIGAYREGGAALPTRLAWPRHAQFAVSRLAVRARTHRFWEANANLTALPAPLKPYVKTDMHSHIRTAKWANFGPFVVDLGPLPPPRLGAPDNRLAANGMDLAMMYERLWFVIFDPYVQSIEPLLQECYSREAIRLSPLRCGGVDCPMRTRGKRSLQQPHGCALTDRQGLSSPQPEWRFAPDSHRCLSERNTCNVSEADEAALGTALWKARNSPDRPRPVNRRGRYRASA